MPLKKSNDLPADAEADLVLFLQVKKSLQHRGYRVLRTLAVHINQGAALVQGQVPSFFLKQVAIECIKSVGGVTSIIDRIEVVAPNTCLEPTSMMCSRCTALRAAVDETPHESSLYVR